MSRTMLCSVCNTAFAHSRDFELHSCEIAEFGGRCEDFPCCGHGNEGCQDRKEFHSEYWAEKFSNMSEDEMDDYEYRMEMQVEYDGLY